MKENIVQTNGVSCHGECTLVLASLMGITELPPDAKEVKADKLGRLLVAHSESGHHHYVNGKGVKMYETNDPLVKFLDVEYEAHALLRHAKPVDDSQRHDTQRLDSGLYRVTLQRESTPEGWRQVMD